MTDHQAPVADLSDRRSLITLAAVLTGMKMPDYLATHGADLAWARAIVHAHGLHHYCGCPKQIDPTADMNGTTP